MTSLVPLMQPAATGPPAYSQTFPCEPSTAEAGRTLVRDALGVWHLDDLADVTALIVSELIANAVTHTSCRSIRLIVGRPSATRNVSGWWTGRLHAYRSSAGPARPTSQGVACF